MKKTQRLTNNPKVILVTGCAGFIASNFVKQFKQKFNKTKIIGIDDFFSGRRDAVDKDIIFYEGSILDEGLLEKIFSKHKPEYVFHFAARPRVSYSVKYPIESSEVNILGTLRVLVKSSDHKVKRFIYSASSSVYGGAKNLPTKESENFPDPKSPYALQKFAGEQFCRLFSALYNLDTVCLRYFSVFGPGSYGGSPYSTFICAWLEAMYFPKNKDAFLEGDGNQSRDFCYVDNVISANILAMESKNDFGGEVFNIASGEKISLNDVHDLIEKFTNKKLKIERRPDRPGDVRHTLADVSKAQKVFGYRPQVDFKEGLRRTVEWFKNRKK